MLVARWAGGRDRRGGLRRSSSTSSRCVITTGVRRLDARPRRAAGPAAGGSSVTVIAAVSVLASVYLTLDRAGDHRVHGLRRGPRRRPARPDRRRARLADARSGRRRRLATRCRSRRSTSTGCTCSPPTRRASRARSSQLGPFGGAQEAGAGLFVFAVALHWRRARPRRPRLRPPRPLGSAALCETRRRDRQPLPSRPLRAARRRSSSPTPPRSACGGCSPSASTRRPAPRRSPPRRPTRRCSPRSGAIPNGAAGFDDAAAARIEELAMHPRVAAVGETGLDFYRDSAPPRGSAPRVPRPDRDRPAARQAAGDPRARQRDDHRRRRARADVRDPARRGGRGRA